MAGLVSALASAGKEVTYVAQSVMSNERAALGWKPPVLGAARLHLAPDPGAVQQLVNAAPDTSIHICQGLRGNELVGFAQKQLRKRGLRQWIVMETVEEHGELSTLVKRVEYWRLIASRRKRICGVLATGHTTPQWLVSRGMPRDKIFPFAYFLPDRSSPIDCTAPFGAKFSFIFVGNLIERKRVESLITSLAASGNSDASLAIVGSGPLEGELRSLADRLLPGRVTWCGTRPLENIPELMACADCLVLPSRHDGWGAVVSEAMMAGTPVICSDRCGSAGVVRASGKGGVFRFGDEQQLTKLLTTLIGEGPPTPQERRDLADWAARLGAVAGAAYLAEILDWRSGLPRPVPPWDRKLAVH